MMESKRDLEDLANGDDGEDDLTNPLNTCRLEIGVFFWDVVESLTDTLNVDRGTAFKEALSLFQEFARTMGASPRADRNRPRPRADLYADLVREYCAADPKVRGERSKVLRKFAKLIGTKHRPASMETMKQTLRRAKKRQEEDAERRKEREAMLRRRDKAAQGYG